MTERFERKITAYITPEGEYIEDTKRFGSHIDLKPLHEAFRDGWCRVALKGDAPCCFQWGGTLTAAQRRIITGMADTMDQVIFEAASEGYDPEMRWHFTDTPENSKVNIITTSNKRAFNQGLRMKMGKWGERYD